MSRVQEIKSSILSNITSQRTKLDVNAIVELIKPALLPKKGSLYTESGGSAETLKGDTQRGLTLLRNAGHMIHEGPKQGGYWRLTAEGRLTPENRAARKLAK